MAIKKDKEKVLDEVWTEDRVKEFLGTVAPEGVNPDFHMLLKAYQSMRADNFGDFVGFFLAKGYDINATDEKGQTVLSLAKQHRTSTEFVSILESQGANK